MAYADNLITTRDQIAERLVEMTASPKPSYSVHGHTYHWGEYFELLTKQLEQVNRLIAQGSPVEIVTQGR
jgi:hypothetical protein